MTIVQDMKQPMTIIDSLIKKPERSEELIAELENKYHKLFGDQVEVLEEKKEEETKEEEV